MLKIAIIQTKLHWENSAANLAHFTQQMAEVSADTDLVVLPEMFLSGFTMNAAEAAVAMDSEELKQLCAIAKQQHIHLIGSVAVCENGKYYNRLIHVAKDGAIQNWYDKRHLFRLANEQNHYTAGSRFITVAINDVVIRPLICYDLRFPVFSRNDKRTPFDLLLYVANWPARRSYAWRQLLIARAIENVCYAIGVNRIGTDGNQHTYSGDSMVVSPLGEVVVDARDEETILYYTIEKNNITTIRQQFPFLEDGDDFVI